MALDKLQTCRLCFSSAQMNLFHGVDDTYNKYAARIISKHFGQVNITTVFLPLKVIV